MKVKQPKPIVSFKMNHKPVKSQKHETLQKLSKKFIKPSVSNSITKYTTPTKDHHQVVRKETLTKKGQESLQMTHNHFYETLGNSPDHTLLTIWEHYRKSSTVNQYANPWFKYVEYSKAAGSQPIPVNPFLFTTWLVVTSLSDTKSSTETRCATIAFFSKEAFSKSPTSHQVVKMTRESIVRK